MCSKIEDRIADWVWDQQRQSPLYINLPAEIRVHIFKLTVEQYFDNPGKHNFRVRHDHDDYR